MYISHVHLHFPCTYSHAASPIISILQETEHLLSADGPALTHCNQPKFLVDIRAHSYCCTFCGFA